MGIQEASCPLPSCDIWTVGIMHLARSVWGWSKEAGREGQKEIKPLTPHDLCCYMLSESRDVRGVTEETRRAVMTKADIVEDIAQRTGLTKKEVAETVDLFLEKIGDLLVNGQHLEIRGFGTFKVKERKERMARNPRTGEAVPVPSRKVPVFKVSKMLKDKVAAAS